MGVPSVTPCSVPDWKWTRSFSSRYNRYAISPANTEDLMDTTNRSGEVALAGTAAGELDLDVSFGQFQTLKAEQVSGGGESKSRVGPTGGTPSMMAPTDLQWLSP